MCSVNQQNNQIVLDIAYTAVFAALIVALGFVSIPAFAGVPIVLQNAACVLAGLILGPRRGFFAVALFMILAAVGLPVLAGGRTLIPALAGPTVGYLVGYLVSPLLAGWVSAGATMARTRLFGFLLLGGIVGIASQYVLGVAGLLIRTDSSLNKLLVGQVAFLPGDAIKLVIITVISFGVILALPQLRNFKQVTIVA